MRICILVQNEEQLASAGTRIRYGRLQPHLEALGHAVEIRPIAEAEAGLEVDVCLLSKCHDARAAIVGATLRGRCAVGIDVFDDYYSQEGDSRLTHLRAWFEQLSGLLDFALCSTPVLAELLRDRLAALPVHMVNDPIEPAPWNGLTDSLVARRERALSTGELPVGWFGIGDNPTFPVGVSDIVAFSDRLAQLGAGRYRPILAILTNRRALTPSALAALARLPVSWTLEEWSPEREAELLARTLCSYIPVNAQPFSAAKSLNRALTALTAGAQVLSPGHPLYARLGSFVYDAPEALLQDLEAGTLALRPERLDELAALLGQLADPAAEAERLAAFLQSVARPKPAPAPPYMLLHGSGPSGAAHKLAQTMGALSVASPFCPQGLNYDVRFAARVGRPVALLNGRAVERLAPDLRPLAVHLQAPAGGLTHGLDLGPDPRALLFEISADPAAVLARYPVVLAAAREVLARMFPQSRVLLSEERPPFPITALDGTAA